MRRLLAHITLAAIFAAGSASLLGAQGVGGGAPRQGLPPGGRGGPGGPGRPGGPPCSNDALAKALNLTADQRVTFDQITKDAQTSARPIEDQLQQLRADVRAAGPDSEEAKAAIATAAQLRTHLSELRAQSRASLRQILTPDQRERLGRIDAQTTGRGGPGPGRGRAGGRGGRPGGPGADGNCGGKT